MKIKTTPIGTVTSGDNGADQYVLLTREDDDLTPQQAIDWLLPQVYQRCRGSGQKFVDTVRASQVQYMPNQVICTVQVRYDI